MATVQDLRNHGLACFTHVKKPASNLAQSPFNAPFQDIATALGNEDTVKAHLDLLEKSMWFELQRSTRDAPVTKQEFKDHYKFDPKAKFDPSPKEDKPHKSLLSKVLRETEEANGFGKVSYAWGVSAKAFLSNLQARRPFKDYSAGITTHGEYTHRIQWWIVCNKVLPPSGNNANLYAECANWTCMLTDVSPQRQIYVWDYLFDSASNTTGLQGSEVKGRNPGEFFGYCKDKERYPLLAAFLIYRTSKAESMRVNVWASEAGDRFKNRPEFQSGVPLGVLERAARRFRHTTFDALSPKEQDKLYATIMKAGFTDHDL